MRPQTGNREKKRRNERKKLRDGPSENLWGGGGAGEILKKEFAQGKIKWKTILARQLTVKNIHTMA